MSMSAVCVPVVELVSGQYEPFGGVLGIMSVLTVVIK